MRVSAYLACAAALACARADDGAAAPSAPAQYRGAAAGRFLEPVAVQPDRETVDYLLPRLTAKYRPAADWSGVPDPRFYLLTEMESNDIDSEALDRKKRLKRFGASTHANIALLQDMYTTFEKMKQQAGANRRMLQNSL